MKKYLLILLVFLVSGCVNNSNRMNYEDGSIIYFDVTTGKSCTNYHEDNSKSGYNGISDKKTTENQNGCLKFYAFNDNGENTLNLLLDHNTSDDIIWTSGSNNMGPKEVITQLANDTNAWQGTESPNNYEGIGGSNLKYTVDYTSKTARLITAEEIAKITDNTSWTPNSSKGYYLDTKTNDASNTCKKGNTTKCKYSWLYDRTSTFCEDYGCLNNSDGFTWGYWTATASSRNYSIGWSVDKTGNLDFHYVDFNLIGVRPVIEVLKSKLN
ncbi:MAG: hypothetical protein IJE04_05800 [Bacilli bacterium]|nr:hypothetical protein [Bacilli bacterium]